MSVSSSMMAQPWGGLAPGLMPGKGHGRGETGSERQGRRCTDKGPCLPDERSCQSRRGGGIQTRSRPFGREDGGTAAKIPPGHRQVRKRSTSPRSSTASFSLATSSWVGTNIRSQATAEAENCGAHHNPRPTSTPVFSCFARLCILYNRQRLLDCHLPEVPAVSLIGHVGRELGGIVQTVKEGDREASNLCLHRMCSSGAGVWRGELGRWSSHVGEGGRGTLTTPLLPR